ncbi:DUF4159 domain-containing protein [bacterium]|nr:DUF4159 domain-containing protein [bacterium]
MATRSIGILGLALILAAGAAEDGRDPSTLVIARVKYGGGGDWYCDPSSLPNLIRGLRERTPVRVAEREKVVQLSDADLFSHPFIYLSGHEQIKLTDEEVSRLRRYLLRGGFLWCDDNYGLDEYFRSEMARVFPDLDWKPVEKNHAIYHCYYDLPDGLPKIHEHHGGPPQGLALYDEDGRMMVYYTYNTDIGDGLEDAEVHRDPDVNREKAMRMAINIVIYALTH